MKGVAAFLSTDQKPLRPDKPRQDAPRDIYRWAMEQANYIKTGRFKLLDRAFLADEIEDLARREYDALVSDLTVVLQHMLKWDHQPERVSRSWANFIAEHRNRVERSLKRSASLKAKLVDIVPEAYAYGRLRASTETNRSVESFPVNCPYDWPEITMRTFAYEP